MNKSLFLLEIPFRGSRNYLSAAAVFNALSDELKQRSRLLFHSDVEYSFHKVIGVNNVEFCMLSNSHAFSSKEWPIVLRSRVASGDTITIVGRPVNDRSLGAKRVAYDETRERVEAEVIGSTIVFNGCASYSPLETIVSLKKKLLEETFPDALGKWVFSRIVLDKIWSKEPEIFRVEFKVEISMRLFKSNIYLDDEYIGQIFFSLVAT